MDQSPSLLLIGTVHGDPRGYERALKLLERFQPDLVTVEVSRFSLRYRQRQEAELAASLAASPGDPARGCGRPSGPPAPDGPGGPAF